jgi:hypothetical protein
METIEVTESTFMDYTFGVSESKKGSAESLDSAKGIKVYPASSYLQKLSIRNDSERFFMLQETQDAQNITIGNQVHEVLSAISTADDLLPVLKQMQQAGELDEKAAKAVSTRIQKLFEDPNIAPWFSGGFEVLNEREIWHNNRIHKPDRILTQGRRAIVIDYKKEKEAESHHEQVRRYMKAMHALGFEEVEGHLIYVEPVVVREVNP